MDNTALKEMRAALAELNVKMEQLHLENQAQVTELKNLKTSCAVTEDKLEALKRDRTGTCFVTCNVSQVAFSVALLDEHVEKTFGPHNVEMTLVYKYVACNIGSAYNPQTGIFTAPIRGVHHFEIRTFSNSGTAAVFLKKNGQGICMAYAHQTSGTYTAANAVSLLLEPGDTVFVTLPVKRTLYDNEHHHNTFCGHLLFTL